MSKRRFFEKASKAKASEGADFAKGIREIKDFLNEACKTLYIDGFVERDKENMAFSTKEFCLKAAESDIRYRYSSLRRGTDYSKWITGKGEVESRNKLFDYYIRLKKNKETGQLHLEFTVQGHSRLSRDWGSSNALILDKFDKRKTNPFFEKVTQTIVSIDPAIRASAQRILRKLDRLTKDSGPN